MSCTYQMLLLRGTGGHRFEPGPRHTKVVNKGTSCSSLSTQDSQGKARTGRPSVRIMWLGVVSSQVSGAWIFNIKVSTELPVATRHHRNMTEKLLKATSNPNKQQQHTKCSDWLGIRWSACDRTTQGNWYVEFSAQWIKWKLSAARLLNLISVLDL